MAAYHAAIAGEATPTPKKASAKSGTLNWLVARYRDSAAWTQLSMATRRARENIFRHVIESAGDEPFASIDRKTIATGRDRRKETPFAANDFLKAMRGLFRWAADAGFVKSDPTEGVKGLSAEKQKVFTLGPRMKSNASRRDGLSERASGWRWRYCSTPVCGAATPPS